MCNSQTDYLVAPRSDADIGNGRFDELFYSVQIGPRRCRKIFQCACVGCRRAPSRECFIHRLCVTQHREIAGKFGEHVLATRYAVQSLTSSSVSSTSSFVTARSVSPLTRTA